ncbi:hypothetical protein ACJRO7_018788 [Eucalyptus globulus]|uniref:Large ribosomal subunit protein uL5c n=1 Tax=Eucalyptus globulus TaxID=34317 RepID=A0ABD3KUY4_EUCGL
MACPSLLPAASASSSSSFHGQLLRLAPPPPPVVRAGRRSANGGMSVRASGAVVLVEKSAAEKTQRLKAAYLEKIVPLLKDEFSYANIQQVPKIEKVVVNCGIGEAAQNAKGLDAAMNDMALITGQRPIKTRARVSLAQFKIREGQPLGIAVTLRGNVMYSFLDRLINLGFPRTRDFQGLNPNSFDGYGNYSVGIQDQSVFPEIRFDAIGKPRGMDVCITTTATTDQEAQRLLALMGMPFREGGGSAALPRKKKLRKHHFDSKSKGRSRR